MKNLVIVGVGLIGGSLGLAVKKKRLAQKVIGVSRKLSTLREARRLHAIDEGTLDLKKAVSIADLVVLATPVSSVIPLAKKIAPFRPAHCVVTDVASTKGDIVSKCEKLFDGYFVGGHPMSGSEKHGVNYSKVDLFKNSVCILTKTGSPSSKNKVASLWRGVGAKVKWLHPKEHDAIVASVSHFPHLLSSLLVLSQNQKKKNVNQLLDFSAGGFRDMTRIAASHPQLWTDIFLDNKKEIIKMIDHFNLLLQDWRRYLKNENDKKISTLLSQAKHLREKLH